MQETSWPSVAECQVPGPMMLWSKSKGNSPCKAGKFVFKADFSQLKHFINFKVLVE